MTTSRILLLFILFVTCWASIYRSWHLCVSSAVTDLITKQINDHFLQRFCNDIYYNKTLSGGCSGLRSSVLWYDDDEVLHPRVFIILKLTNALCTLDGKFERSIGVCTCEQHISVYRVPSLYICGMAQRKKKTKAFFASPHINLTTTHIVKGIITTHIILLGGLNHVYI